MKQINWGIIGLGNIAEQFAEAFQYSDNARLVAIASLDKNKIFKFKKRFQIEEKYCFDSYEKLLSSHDIDIVYIALPNSHHHKWIVNSIKSNKDFLVEKPAVINLHEIEDIRKIYYKNNVFFGEALMYLYHPQISKVIELIKENTIGELLSMETFFGKNIITKKNFLGFEKNKKIDPKNRKYNVELGGGVILDLGCYTVSFSTLIASLISNIDYDKAQISNKKIELGATGVDVDASAEIIFENGFKSRMGASFTKDIGKKTRIIGSKGELVIENTWHANPSEINIINEENKKIKVNSRVNVFSYEIEAISRSILENKKKPNFPGLSIEETYGNMKLIDKWLN